MKIYGLKKYLITAFFYLGMFAIEFLLCLLLAFIKGLNIEMAMLIGSVLGLIVLLPAIYYFVWFFVFRKKCRSITPGEGIVVNWQLGFFKHTGSVSVKVNDREYSTGLVFFRDEAQGLVGKSVLYAVFDDVLFLYEIKE